jgi:hypothetical protein
MANQLSVVPFFGNWTGGAFDDGQTNKFARCIASASYRSGITMYVAIERQKGWSMGFSSQEWNLQPRSQIPLSIIFDGQSPWSGSAIALSPQMVTIHPNGT